MILILILEINAYLARYYICIKSPKSKHPEDLNLPYLSAINEFIHTNRLQKDNLNYNQIELFLISVSWF